MPAPPLNRRLQYEFPIQRENYGTIRTDHVLVQTYPTPSSIITPQAGVRNTIRFRRSNSGYPYRNQEVVVQMTGEQMLDLARMIHQAAVATIEVERSENA